MSVGAGERGTPGSRAGKPAGNLPGAAPEGARPSPLRWIFVLLPLLVIAAAASNIAGFWSTPLQQAAREQQARRTQVVRKDEIVREPLPFDPHPAREAAPFDASIVIRLLGTASAEKGASLFRMCVPCHAAEKGGPSRIGPNLWGIVDQVKAAEPRYVYSAALKSKGGRWSYRDLALYLNNPKAYAPGTSMAFFGLQDHQRIADLLAYLRTRADNPAPLPR